MLGMKDIVNNDKLNYFDATYGRGKTRRDNMAFHIIKIMVIGSAVIMVFALIANTVLTLTLGVEFWMKEPLKIYLTAFVSFLMMVVGYLFRGSTEK